MWRYLYQETFTHVHSISTLFIDISWRGWISIHDTRDSIDYPMK